MKPPPVQTLRRLALTAALLTTVIVVVTYGVRRWRAAEARRSLGAPLASDVQQQAEKFTFSRTEQGHTLFTIEAERTTERAGKTTVLEDVIVHIYGRHQERRDQVRTARCEYDAEGGQRIICPGAVSVSLRAQGEEGTAAPGSIELTTGALQFDPNQGVAWTDQPVRFTFPEGSGEAVGLRYQPEEPHVLLEKQVTVQVARPGEPPVFFRGGGLQYYSSSRAFELTPPLEVKVGGRRLVADRLRMELNQNFRTERITASGAVEAQLEQDGRTLAMRAAQAVAEYGSQGQLERLRASDGVEFTGQGGESRERLQCREAVFHFSSSDRALERVVASATADLVTEAPSGTRSLRAPELELRLPGRGGQPQMLAARGRGTLRLESKGERFSATGDRLELELGDKQQLRAFAASGEAETRSQRAGQPERVTHSDELRVRFSPDGQLAGAEQWGHFRASNGRWQAEAGRAEYRSASGTLILREGAAVWDERGRTTARLIEVREQTGELRAEGEVRTTQRAAAEVGLAGEEPIHLAAERLRTSPEENSARYEGQARLWQGENRLSAAAIELLRAPEKLVAEGEVSGLFVVSSRSKESEAAPKTVRVNAERFTYDGSERRGVFEGTVSARGEFGTVTAPRIEVYMGPTGDTESARLERVRARGGVRLEHLSWQATSEEGEYQAEAQTVVLWGGAPTISDPQRGSASGTRLTLFLADDRILLDSAEGTRTVTRRPWSQ